MIERAGHGVEPLVVVVEVAEEMREEEVAAVVAAAERSVAPGDPARDPQRLSGSEPLARA